MVEPETSIGGLILDRMRRLIALDRVLIEIGEPGVLERPPAELASLESRLFGGTPPPLEADAGARGNAGRSDAAGAPGAPGAPGRSPITGLPEIRVLPGQRSGFRGPASAEEVAQRQALRAQFRLIPGGLDR